MTRKTHTKPARPERLTFRFAREGDRLAFERRTRGRGGCGFLLLWLIAWTVGCVFLAGMVLHEPTLFKFLFAIPFWVSWIAVFGVILHMTFGREFLLLDRRGAAFGRKVFIQISQRRVPLDEVKRFRVYRSLVTENDQPIWGIEMATLGRPAHMARGMEREERNWLRDQLNEHLAMLQADSGLPGDVSQASDDETDEDESVAESPACPKLASDRGRIVLTLDDQVVRPPSDCRWRREDASFEITFSARGTLHPLAAMGMLFISLFWIGILSVFLCTLWGFGPGPGPQGMEWWGLFAFLIPFEVIGLGMVGGLLYVVVEPFHVRRWTLGQGDVRFRQTWFGFGLNRGWLILGLDRLEVARGPGSRLTRFGSSGRSSTVEGLGDMAEDAGGGFKLSLIDRDNNELCSLGRLTEGEARWIGDVILRERPEWFGRT